MLICLGMIHYTPFFLLPSKAELLPRNEKARHSGIFQIKHPLLVQVTDTLGKCHFLPGGGPLEIFSDPSYCMSKIFLIPPPELLQNLSEGVKGPDLV